MEKNSDSFVFSWLAIHFQKVDRHNPKWLYYSSMRHSTFCSPYAALQNPMYDIQNTLSKSCVKRDTRLWTIIVTKKGRLFVYISSKFHLLQLKVAAQTYVNGRNIMVISKTVSDFIQVSFKASRDHPRWERFLDLSFYRTNGVQSE